MTAWLAAAGLVACLLCRAAAARAAPSPPSSIAVVASGCGAGLPEVRELPDRLAVELAPVRIDAGATALVEIVTSCTAVERIIYRSASSGAGAPQTTRPVSLADVAPRLRAVTLAVMTAEFLRWTWGGAPAAVAAPATEDATAAPVEGLAEAHGTASPVGTAAMPPVTEAPVSPASSANAPAEAPNPVPPPKTASPEADHPPVRGARGARAESGVRYGAAGLFRWFSRPASKLWGGELSLDLAPWFVAASVALGEQANRLGLLAYGLAAASAGGRITVARWDDVAIRGSALGEIGFTWAKAEGREADVIARSTGALYLALMVGPDLDVSLSRTLGLTLGVRAGVARGLSITADRQQIAGTQGFATAATLGLRYQPP